MILLRSVSGVARLDVAMLNLSLDTD